MSSVLEENRRLFRNLLIRQASLDKLKCSAYSTIGSIISKKSSLIHIFENAMNSSRTLLQVPMITIIAPSLHIICVAMSLLIGLIRKYFSGGMSVENLENFISKLNQLKAERRLSIQKLEQEPKHEEIKDSSSTNNAIVFHECAAVKRRDRLLTIASVGSVAFVYVQLSLLVYMIGVSAMKLGLLFMLICITALAYFTLKISFTMKSSGEQRRNSRRHKSTVRHKQIGKALTLRQITCVLPQIIFNSCGGKFSAKKEKSS